MAAHNIKTSHSSSRRSIPQVPNGDAHQWQHTTSKPASPYVDARFHKCPLETHVTESTPHQNQPFPISTGPDFLASLPPMTAATHKNKGRLPHVGVRFHKVTLHTKHASCDRSSGLYGAGNTFPQCDAARTSMQNVIRSKRLLIRFHKVTLHKQACKMLSK